MSDTNTYAVTVLPNKQLQYKKIPDIRDRDYYIHVLGYSPREYAVVRKFMLEQQHV